MKNYDLLIHPEEVSMPCRRVDLLGCLDSHTVISFEKDMDRLLEDGGVSKVLLSLEGLSYISSAGISALMGLTHQLRQRDGELFLLRPTEKVLRVFRTLGFTNIFRIVEDETEVVAGA